MSAKALQGIAKGRNVKDILNKKFLSVKRDDHCPTPQHWGKRLVSHADPEIGNALLGDELRVVRKHVVGSVRIRHNEDSRGQSDERDFCDVGRKSSRDSGRKYIVGR